MKYDEKIMTCDGCKKTISQSEFSKYYKCQKHNKFYCNECIQKDIFCQRCETESKDKKNIPPEEEDILMKKIKIIGFILVLIIVISTFSALSVDNAIIATFILTFYVIFMIISYFELKRYPNRYYRRRTVKLDDRAVVNAFTGLLGDWSYPILTKDERLGVFSHVREKINLVSITIIFIGSIIIVIGIIISINLFIIFIGCMFIVTGVAFISYMKYARKSYMGIEPIEITKTTELKEPIPGIVLMEELLNSIGEPYRKETEITHIFQNYWMKSFKYIFNNKNYIIYAFMDYPDADFTSAIGVGYYLDFTIHAREIFKKLDRFLVDNKLIQLFDKDAYDYSTWGKG
jgi:hypothetical protein